MARRKKAADNERFHDPAVDGDHARDQDREMTRDHNMGNRKDTVIDAFQRMYALRRQIKEIIDSDVKPLREEVSDIKAMLLDRFNMPAKLVNLRYTAYEAERRAVEAGDEVTQDAIRELFEILPVTGQGSFAPALDALGGRDGRGDDDADGALLQ